MAEQGAEDGWPENHGIRRVLVVDDNETNRNLVQEILIAKKIACLQASNGMEALQLMEENGQIDLVFMDLRMPFLDGMETTQKIRKLSDPALSQVPVVLLSSSNDDALDRTRMRDLRINHRILKPIKVHQLAQVIQKIAHPDEVAPEDSQPSISIIPPAVLKLSPNY